jgi:hypothetical protein
VVMKAATIVRARVCWWCSLQNNNSTHVIFEIFDERLQRRKIPTLSLQKKTQMQRGEHVHCIRRRSFGMEVYRCRFGLHQSTRVHTIMYCVRIRNVARMIERRRHAPGRPTGDLAEVGIRQQYRTHAS